MKGKRGIQKGEVLNPKGRPKGTTNSAIDKLRELANNLSFEYLNGKFKEDWETVDPEIRLKFMSALFNKMLPSIQSVNLTGTINAEQMQQMINKKFPFSGLNPSDVTSAIQQESPTLDEYPEAEAKGSNS